jgi:predicted metal-binding protein
METDTRDAYMSRVLQNPASMNFTEIRFIYSAQIIVGAAIRQRCQYACSLAHQSILSPPLTPGAQDTRRTLDEYRYGLIVRRKAPLIDREFRDVWREFSDNMLEFEHESFIRGYPKAFVPAVGACLFGHNDDRLRPCDYPHKSRPTFEAIGVNLGETLDMIGWESHIIRDDHDPFQMFSVLMLE